MTEDLEILCSWEIEIIPNGSKEIMDGIASTLQKSGFKKKEDWSYGIFTVSPFFTEGNPYHKLRIYFKARHITNTSLISILDHEIRKYEGYIKSIKFEKNSKYLEKK